MHADDGDEPRPGDLVRVRLTPWADRSIFDPDDTGWSLPGIVVAVDHGSPCSESGWEPPVDPDRAGARVQVLLPNKRPFWYREHRCKVLLRTNREGQA